MTGITTLTEPSSRTLASQRPNSKAEPRRSARWAKSSAQSCWAVGRGHTGPMRKERERLAAVPNREMA